MPFFSRLCEAVSSKQDDVEFLEATGGSEAVVTFLRWIRGTREEEESPRRDTGGAVLQRRQNSFQEFQASKHSEAVASAQAAAASAANAASSSVANAITAGVSVTSTMTSATTSIAPDRATAGIAGSPMDTATATTSLTGNNQTASAEELSASFDDSGGLSEASKIGLGVGLGLGIPLLFAAVVLLCFIRRRRRGNKQTAARYSRQAQSDLSMVEQAQSVQPKADRALDAPLAGGMPPPGKRETADYNGKYDEAPPAPPAPSNVDNTSSGQNLKDAIEPASRSRDQAVAPLTLLIPGQERRSDVSREASPSRSHSPASPVSPISVVSQVSSRPSSLKAL
ncbi:hypothetical protein CKM354_000096600 [Cercospora kikuchii]|uniref:Mid2 domain-containing protein n=1 Tax=Cercospora kikuchii TaxID=84275 RepID=A0A9P3C9W5_9PEZI|nr:uncharacterized protein CKM354_000096600 [Cercospora kikuchii]GIZ37521.1 hypothetical protein CKM354_000096600 [Cercospora kikuchii]